MTERIAHSPETQELPRNPYEEVYNLLGIFEDGKSTVTLNRKYETPEVDVVVSGNNDKSRSKYNSITVELYHHYSRFVKEGEKTRSAVFQIHKDGTMNGMLFEEYIPGVDETFAWAAYNKADRQNRRDQVMRVVDFVKSIAQGIEAPLS